MFLPSKGEIAEMKTGLCSAGVPVQQMQAIHGDMAPKEVRQRTQQGGTQVYLSTNAGETSLTIPGVVVVSVNLQRRISYGHPENREA